MYEYDLKSWTTEEIKNALWQKVNCGSQIRFTADALRQELTDRGESPYDHHDLNN